MRWLLAPYSDSRTYRILLYSVLGLPLGFFYFGIVVTGLLFGFRLFIVLVGIPILFGSLLVTRALRR